MQQLDSSISILFDEQEQVSLVDRAAAEINMDKDLYKAANDGEIGVLLNKYQGDLRCLLDAVRNTVLHIHSRAGGITWGAEPMFSINFVEQVLEKCPSLLLQPNTKGEIPFHVALKHGNLEMAKFLIERMKQPQPHDDEDVETGTKLETSSSRMILMREMLTKKDKEGNTPLHKVVESCFPDLVELLMEELGPDLSFSANASGETPLYLAASLVSYNNFGTMTRILDYCKSKSISMSMNDFGGPDGASVLHVVVDLAQGETNEGTFGINMVKKLIEAKSDLTQKTDDKGRTPLHYAAHMGMLSITKVLLEADASAAYIRDKERESTALHMAAWQGELDIMKEIISHCPGCSEIVDKRDWNFLHFAAFTISNEKLGTWLFREAYGNPNMHDLLGQKNINGATPEDIAMIGFIQRPEDDRIGPFFKGREFSNLVTKAKSKNFQDEKKHREDDESASFYKKRAEKKLKQVQKSLKEIDDSAELDGKRVLESFRKKMEEEKEKKKEKDEKRAQEFMDKTRDAHLLVVTLVATVTFAIVFTMPGGYKADEAIEKMRSPASAPKPDPGTAILIHDSAFKAFVITDTVAFVSSVLAIFIHFLVVYFRGTSTTYKFQLRCIFLAGGLTFLAMAAMVVAFSTGTYAVLKPSLGFAIAICSLGLAFFLGLILSICFMLYYLKKLSTKE